MTDLADNSQKPVLKLPHPAPAAQPQKPAAPTRGPIAVQVRSIKITAVLSPADLPPIVDGVSELRLELEIGGQSRTAARLNPKSYRRAWRTIQENGPENVNVILQGRMSRFNQIEDAGLAVTVKTPKPAPSDTPQAPSEPAAPQATPEPSPPPPAQPE